MVISSKKFENFELFCPLGVMKRGRGTAKKVIGSATAKPGTHIHIFLDAIKLLWRAGEGVGARTKLLGVSN